MKIVNKNITDIPFIKASGAHCGIKKSSKNDISLIFSEKKAVSAAAFTKNKVKAAPVYLNMEHVKNENTQAIVVNSGIANACTGEKGLENSKEMAKYAAAKLGLKENEVLVGSTGVIGTYLPMDKIKYGIDKCSSTLSKDGSDSASLGIMTTDTFIKKASVETEISGKEVTISGIAKGSGMIHPNMGTMFAFMFTDADISKELLNKSIKECVKDSFNMISVDGDTSTNDMAIVIANGAAENKKIIKEDDSYENFKSALSCVCKMLAKKIAQDGEGSTKLIETNVIHAKTDHDARILAKSVISSNLVKAAIFGSDANWGRVLCALGYSGGDFNPNNLNITFKSSEGSINVVKNGIGLSFDEELAKKILDCEYVKIDIDTIDGDYSATAWGCDLTYDYVKINGSYRS